MVKLPGQLDDLKTLFGKLNSVAYAYKIDETKSLVAEWHCGSILGQAILPISTLLTGALAEGEAAQVRKHLDRLTAGNPSQVDLLWTGERTTLRVRDSAHPKFDNQGRVVRILGTVQDVTTESWYKGEQELIEWFPRIVESMAQGLCCWDSHGNMVLTNAHFRSLYQEIAAYLQPGLNIRDFVDLVAQTHLFAIDEPVEDWSERVLDDFDKRHSRELLLSDGRTFEFVPHAIAYGTLLVVQDVTSVRSGERALRNAKAVAEAADLKKSRFLRAANHDLRQPLATLKILIYSSADPIDEEHRLQLLNSMDVSVTIMEDILGSLLQIGQLDAERIAPRETHFQVSQLLERLAIEFTPQAEAKGLRFHVVPCHVTLKTDRALLERIVSNFVANAIRFTEVGTILLGARRRGSVLEIQTWDTGPGIPNDQLQLIFEEFHQVAERSSRKHKGLGLGLNIVQRLAQLMRHPIHVQSKEGRGSMFSVSVPMGNVWQSETGEPEISERIGGEFVGMNMLIIDDDEPLRTAMGQLLERWGVSVLAAQDGDQAMELLHGGEWAPDLVIVDYRLPNGSAGTEVLSRLGTLIPPDVPGIVLTADTDPSTIAAIRDQGLPVLIKPINPSRLRSLMHHLLFEREDDVSQITVEKND